MTEEQMWCWWLIPDEHYPWPHRTWRHQEVERLRLYGERKRQEWQDTLRRFAEEYIRANTHPLGSEEVRPPQGQQ